jgi:type IV fimbrial biogenesis protein FimT
MTALHAPSPAAQRRPARGLSIVELLCCASIAATLLGTALPSLSGLGQRQRLQSAAAELQADLNLARTTALLHGQPVRLSWYALPTGGACYVVHSGDADQCSCGSGSTVECSAGAQPLRAVVLPAEQGITLTAATRSVLFDSRKGTVTPTATFKLGNRQGQAQHLVINVMGRVRSCSPGGQLAGVKAC